MQMKFILYNFTQKTFKINGQSYLCATGKRMRDCSWNSDDDL